MQELYLTARQNSYKYRWLYQGWISSKHTINISTLYKHQLLISVINDKEVTLYSYDCIQSTQKICENTNIQRISKIKLTSKLHKIIFGEKSLSLFKKYGIHQNYDIVKKQEIKMILPSVEQPIIILSVNIKNGIAHIFAIQRYFTRNIIYMRLNICNRTYTYSEIKFDEQRNISVDMKTILLTNGKICMYTQYKYLTKLYKIDKHCIHI